MAAVVVIDLAGFLHVMFSDKDRAAVRASDLFRQQEFRMFPGLPAAALPLENILDTIEQLGGDYRLMAALVFLALLHS